MQDTCCGRSVVAVVSDVREYRNEYRVYARYGIAASVPELRGELAAFDVHSVGVGGKRIY